MGDGGYIGYAGASSTEVSVVADIAESLDISGFTPSISVSSMPALEVSSMVLATPMAVSGTVLTTAPVNQNVSGISLDAIKTAAEGVLADTALMVPDLDAIRVDTAANEVLLTGIDTVLDNILTKNTEIDTALDTIDGVLDSSLTKQTEIDTVLDNILTKNTEIDTALDTIDGVLDSSLTKQTEIDTALDTIDGVLDSSLTKQTEIDAVLDNILTKNTEIDAVLDTIKVDTEAIETAVELLDNAIDGNEMQVDVVSMPTTTVTGSITAAVSFPATTGITGGGAESGAQRVTIANDSTGSVGIKPSTSSYLSHVYIDLDATGDNPTTNTEVIAAPGASNKLVIYGVQGSIVGSADSAAGNWFLSDGNASAATTLWTGRAQGLTNTQFELTFPYGVALTANTALKVTSTESSGHIFINAVVYYRTEAT